MNGRSADQLTERSTNAPRPTAVVYCVGWCRRDAPVPEVKVTNPPRTGYACLIPRAKPTCRSGGGLPCCHPSPSPPRTPARHRVVQATATPAVLARATRAHTRHAGRKVRASAGPASMREPAQVGREATRKKNVRGFERASMMVETASTSSGGKVGGLPRASERQSGWCRRRMESLDSRSFGPTYTMWWLQPRQRFSRIVPTRRVGERVPGTLGLPADACAAWSRPE